MQISRIFWAWIFKKFRPKQLCHNQLVRVKIRYFEERWQQKQRNLEENQEDSSQILQNVDHFESRPDGVDEDVDMKDNSDSLGFYQDIEIKGDTKSGLNENTEEIEVKNDNIIENDTPISHEIEIKEDPESLLENASNEIHEFLDTNEFHQKPTVMKDTELSFVEVEHDENETPVSHDIEIKENPEFLFENASNEIHENLDANEVHQKPLDKLRNSVNDETPTDDTYDPSKPLSILNSNSENLKQNSVLSVLPNMSSNDTEENNCNKFEKYRLFKTKNKKRNILQPLHIEASKSFKKELNCQTCVVKQFKSESDLALHKMVFHEKKIGSTKTHQHTSLTQCSHCLKIITNDKFAEHLNICDKKLILNPTSV